MRKQIFGRRLKRDTNERKALFRALMISLVLHGKISTSEAKAKAIKGDVDKLITYVKNDPDNAKRLIMMRIPNEAVADKIITEIAPKFAKRPGGYTRILKLGERVKDGSRQVLMSWTEEVKPTSLVTPKRNVNKPKTENKKQEKVEKKEAKKPAKAKK